MTNSLATSNFNEIQMVGRAMAQSGFFADSKSEAQAIVKIMAGREIGLGAFAAMSGIHIIQGKPVMGANLLATLIKNDPRYDYKVVTLTDADCSIDFYENDQKIGTSAFSASDAKKAGSKNMDKYPRNMLFARAISNGAKWYTPGIFGGLPVYTPDEFGMEVNDDGDPVIVDAVIVEDPGRQDEQDDLRMFKSTTKQAIVDKGYAENLFAAAGMLDHSNLPGDVSDGIAVAWARNYRGAREDGKTTPEAAELANSAYTDYLANS